MNFFERQDRARRNSRLLLVLFALGLAGSVAVIDVAAMLLWHLYHYVFVYAHIPLPRGFHHWVIGGTAALILFMSVRKAIEVRNGGGMAIARMMGARQVVPLNATPLEKRLLNIVQEMAIASGTRVPLVYVMDDHGAINAFAAGFDGTMCVIVVTRGALQRLNRNELQGVIGHEFSHIVNGDMALNLRMIGLLSGLLVIGAAGEHLMRQAPQAEGWGPVALFVVGLIIFVAGYSGLVAGRLIKAMIAREREHLADAGSVQFTRDPVGLAGALDQVRRGHSTILHLHVEEVSHLFFAEAVYLQEERVLTTHPPLEERIARLVPRFRETEYREKRIDALAQLDRDLAPRPQLGVDAAGPGAFTPLEGVAMVGTFGDRNVRMANAFLHALPPAAILALRTREGSSAVALALVLSAQDAVLEREIAAVRATGLDALATAAQGLVALVRALPPAWHLPVADLALAELKRHADADRHDLVRALDAVIGADGMVSVYRYACLTLIRTQLASHAAKPGHESLAALREDVIVILSLVAYASCADKADFAGVFEAGARDMGLGPDAAPVAQERCDAQTLTHALGRLRDLAPLAKARVVRGLFTAVSADGTLRIVEAALMRMVGAVLDCPLPPLMDELDPAKLAA